MNELIEKVEQWAIDRNLHTANPQGQALKVIEEFTETLLADYDNDDSAVIDGIGDAYVTIIILAQQLNDPMLDIRVILEHIKEAPSSSTGYDSSSHNKMSGINRLSDGVSKGKNSHIYVAIMRMLRVLSGLENKYGATSVECLSVAYEEIKDRRGKMIDGVFVKESDLHGNDS